MRSYRPIPVLGLLSTLLLILLTSCATTQERKPAGYNSVAAQIESRKNDFRDCFGETSIPDSIENVRMKVRFWMDSSGSVTQSIITESVMKYPTLDECVNGVIKSIHFGRNAAESTEVTYPLSITRN